jgi:hypothetical protein
MANLRLCPVEIEKFFTLEEAARLILPVGDLLEEAHQELTKIKDDMILTKRLAVARADGDDPYDEDIAVLKKKWKKYEDCIDRWVNRFATDGMILRDIERGVVEFPYKSQDDEIFLLSWVWPEDGLFYFYDAKEGPIGRRPISLLPD